MDALKSEDAIRCAIYTRKSTDEGLDQAFNSLDAQREAGEAYIASQRGEGWTCLPDRYDDGGYTGGNMERPALKRLLADIEADRIDCVVVYKVDRLSRSLMDFSRMMGAWEKRNISFVSVTQQFNTTSSMGRLTLNILFSFAQFEREIISERTRDKIAATRRKGKWSGGRPVLGFDLHPDGGKLIVNEDEAHRVRALFDLYLEHESLTETIKVLDERGWTNKRWTTRKGVEAGGKVFNKHSLTTLLTNVLYRGKVVYKDEIFEGEQPALVDEAVFERVGKLMRMNGSTGGRHVRGRFGALLKGLIRCTPCDSAMVHTQTLKNGTRRYRYYVCSSAQKRGWHSCPSKSIPAGEIEKFVIDQIRSIGKDPVLVAETLEEARLEAQARIQSLETEGQGLKRELNRYNAELRKLAGRVATNGTATDRLADLQDHIQTAEQRSTQIKEELAHIRETLLSEKDVAGTLALFDPVWETLTVKEQRRVMQLLVQRVDYDGEKGTVSVTFHRSGIECLSHEPLEVNR